MLPRPHPGPAPAPRPTELPIGAHQTVRLGPGRHDRPGREVCVMELASMLTGGPFTDHPPSVCPVIAALLRTYNDRVGDSLRQRLIPLAALVLDTRADARTTTRRREAVIAWYEGRLGRMARLRRLLRFYGRPLPTLDQSIIALRCLPRHIDEATHRDVVGLVLRLAAIRPEGEDGCGPEPGLPGVPAHQRAESAAGPLVNA